MDAMQLRDALAARFDQVITPEVAAEILRAACVQPDRSHDPAQFAPQEYRGIVFQVERAEDILEELKPLHEAHFAETEGHRYHLGLDFDYDYLLAGERAGELIQFTARDSASRLVGQVRMTVERSIHTQTLFSCEELLYLKPSVRKGFTAVRFIQYVVDRCLRQIGVQEVRTVCKLATGSHRLMEYLGYVHLSNQYIKSIQE